MYLIFTYVFFILFLQKWNATSKRKQVQYLLKDRASFSTWIKQALRARKWQHLEIALFSLTRRKWKNNAGRRRKKQMSGKLAITFDSSSVPISPSFFMVVICLPLCFLWDHLVWMQGVCCCYTQLQNEVLIEWFQIQRQNTYGGILFFYRLIFLGAFFLSQRQLFYCFKIGTLRRKEFYLFQFKGILKGIKEYTQTSI